MTSAVMTCVGCGAGDAVDRSASIPSYPGALCRLCWRGLVWGVVPPEHAARQRAHQEPTR